MRLIRGLYNMPKISAGALTIGNFDGVHLGHQQIIAQLVSEAKQRQATSIVMSFQPTPQTFFGKPQPMLTNLREKYHILKTLGVDILLIFPFNTAFSQQSAKQFVTDVLVTKLALKYCLIGDDFRFGKNRTGDVDYLQKIGHQYGFKTAVIKAVNETGERISSSRVRALLEVGDFAKVTLLLGREFMLSGRVQAGDKRGRALGFPTLNIDIKRHISPVLGVFAVWVKLADKIYQGVANIGYRPTVDGKKLLLEVHIFHFDKQVYGQWVEVVCQHKIRDEMSFASVKVLAAQINSDCRLAKQYFKTIKPLTVRVD